MVSQEDKPEADKKGVDDKSKKASKAKGFEIVNNLDVPVKIMQTGGMSEGFDNIRNGEKMTVRPGTTKITLDKGSL